MAAHRVNAPGFRAPFALHDDGSDLATMTQSGRQHPLIQHLVRRGESYPGLLVEALLGRDEKASLIARNQPKALDPLQSCERFDEALEHVGLDRDVLRTIRAAGLHDVLMSDADGRQILASWTGSDGVSYTRVALGGDVHLTTDDMILLPDLPTTIDMTLRGRRLGEIVAHPLLDPDETIVATGYRPLWSTTLVRAIRTQPRY